MAEGRMETKRLTLSNRERDRLKVLHEVKQKHLSQVAAAARLKVSDRQVRRMLLRIGERGDAALVHGLRGRPSNRKLAARLEQKILARLRQRYADFGPTLAAEHLAQEGFPVSRETLRKWMSKAALWCPRSQRVKAVRVWRERRARFGELVMQDSSPFRWLELPCGWACGGADSRSAEVGWAVEWRSRCGLVGWARRALLLSPRPPAS